MYSMAVDALNLFKCGKVGILQVFILVPFKRVEDMLSLTPNSGDIQFDRVSENNCWFYGHI